MTGMTRTIDTHTAEKLTKLIDRANRRATKMGQPGYTLTTTPGTPEPVYDTKRILRWIDNADGTRYPIDTCGRIMTPDFYRPMVDVTIDGLMPVLPGAWRMIGFVKEDTATGNPMPIIVDDDIRGTDINLDRFRELDRWSECDHCRKIRSRARVYLVHSTDTGETVRVGKSCLRDFLGVQVYIPESQITKILEGVDDREPGWATSEPCFNINDVLALSLGMVAEYGWRSRAMCMGNPTAMSTAYRVRNALTAKTDDDRLDRNNMISSVDADRLVAFLDYCRNLGANEGTEYAKNVSSLMSSPYTADGTVDIVSASNVALLVSAVRGFTSPKRTEVAAPTRPSRWVGTVGAKCDLGPVTVTRTMIIDTVYGAKQMVVFANTDGDTIVWWNSGAKRLSQGDSGVLTATVKAHELYRNTMQTVVIRAKLG